MKNKVKSFTVSLLCVSYILCLFTTMPTSAVTFTATTGSVKVRCGAYSHVFSAKNYGDNFSRALNTALSIAGKKATSSQRATVKISKGNYALDRCLYIYSNTTLNAKGSTFKYPLNFLKNGYDNSASSAKGYSGSENITIVGGVWNMNVSYSNANNTNPKVTHSTFRFGHCKNIKVKDCMFVNNYNCHDIELGAVNNAVITNCTFKNDRDVNKLYTEGGKEAVQIDSAISGAFPYFPSYDYTPSKNITIKNNTFINKFRGVGSHHAVIGNTYNNISVFNNTFKNIAGFSVYAVYWTNSNIYNNTFTDVGAGIDMRSMISGEMVNLRNFNNLSYRSTDYVTKKSSNYVYGNNIKVRTKDNTCTVPFGIRCSGAVFNQYDSYSKINAGKYSIYNINIGFDKNKSKKPNVISGNLTYGVYVYHGDNCNVKYNQIDLQKAQATPYGVVAKGSNNTNISENTIINGNKENSTGIYVGAVDTDYPSTNTLISNNTISNVAFGGISVNNSCDTLISDNEVANTKYGAVNKANVNIEIDSNNLSNCSQYGIYSTYGSTNYKISNNTISSTSTPITVNDIYDPFPIEEKTGSIFSNNLTCSADVTPISIINANLSAEVFGNIRSDGQYAICRIKGEKGMKYQYLLKDMENPKVNVTEDNGIVALDWENSEGVEYYSVNRTVDGYDTTDLALGNINHFEDSDFSKYIQYSDVSYSVAPCISSLNIKLLGLPTVATFRQSII